MWLKRVEINNDLLLVDLNEIDTWKYLFYRIVYHIYFIGTYRDWKFRDSFIIRNICNEWSYVYLTISTDIILY